MTSARPPEHRPSPGSDDDFVHIERTPSVYNSGQRPPVTDDHLLEQYNIDDSDEPQPRTSVSYDAFVGGGHPAQAAGAHHAAGGVQACLQAPPGASHFYGEGGANRNYSQTSDLHNYQRYSDDLNDFDDVRSAQGYYNDQSNLRGAVALRDSRARDRNSIMTWAAAW
ncbi:hypothetical protein PAAG_12473 [Paracoccidioides lutzii Pb01]|uniref:Uncharacterized protein n=1 Tax=Paracoccidioides lutzii (strain ATCC MYA-826 / Pb01) TaxID=502779 RepID=A0A0A2UZ45_PARBA|nr:hypothetical protein PAAG_12473 [Paracoccidioides lutzii Pb01]KGQ00846.1 hypothetical protein PAAG_12473 [Paracoccidioides lutzii Pb01]